MKKLTIALAISFSLLCAAPVFAQAPTLINFQGKLTDAALAPVNGPAEVVFSIYDAADSLLWSEHHNNVVVKKAIFNILLGTGTPNGAAAYPPLTDILAANTEAWLEVQILDKTKTPLTWETMTPRQRLVSVAYSLHSETAVAADDVPGKDITPNSVTIPAHGQVIDSLGQWTGVTIPSSKLAEDDPQVKAQTVNRLPKWDGAALVDSTSINETAGGNVGIGTAAPGEKLSVAGKIQTSGGIVFPDGTEQAKAGVLTETDPTVNASVKDGVSWTELQQKPADFADGEVKWSEVKGIPAGFADNKDDGLLAETDPTVNASVKDGVSWSELQQKPTDLADGEVNWSEVKGMPAGFSDGVDNGITSETDPQVGTISTNRIPKWNGSQLVSSSSIYENGGSVGIGTTTPQENLDVNGNIKIGFTSSTCNSSHAGSIRWNASTLIFEGCNGQSWQPLSSIGGGGGTLSCTDVLASQTKSGDQICSAWGGQCTGVGDFGRGYHDEFYNWPCRNIVWDAGFKWRCCKVN